MQSFRLSFSTYLSAKDIRIGKGYDVKRRFRKRYMYEKKGNKENSLSLHELYIFAMNGKGKFTFKKKKENRK